MTRTYFIRNISATARKKAEAIESIKTVLRVLGINIEIPAIGQIAKRMGSIASTLDLDCETSWEMLIIHDAHTITATINVYRGKAPDLELPHLTVSDRP